MAGSLSCGGTEASRPRALVLIVIDTLRGDRLGSVGYASARTPTLDSLAVVGTQFRAANTPAPMTLPAVTSLLTGRYPFHHGVRDNDRFVLPEGELTLAERFREAGFRTAAVVGSAVLAEDRGLDQGFESYDDDFQGSYLVYTPSLQVLAGELSRTCRRADVVTDLALKQAHAMDKDPYFLLVHYFDVHMHYDPPPAFASLHPGRPYDGEVSFVDHEIGRLLAGLRDREDVLVVVVADHGESQNEHGEPQHGFLLYQSTLHVPFIAAGPGVPAHAVRDDVVSLVDVEPTLAAAFELGKATVPRDGRTLVWGEPAESVPLYAETFHPLLTREWSELRSVRLGSWKYIQGPTSELFDLDRDPRELTPVENPERARELEGILSRLIEGDTPDEVYLRAKTGNDGQRRELLQSLGYVGGDGETARPGGARPHPHEMLPGWLEQQSARELYRAAAGLVDSGRTAQGLALVDSAIALDPDAPGPYALRGEIRVRNGDLRGAEADAQIALGIDPRSVPSLVLLARIAQAAGHREAACEAWSQVFLAEEENLLALTFLAEWHLHAEDPHRALPFLRRIVSAKPVDPAARFNLALCAYRASRPEEARLHFEVYLRLAPDAEKSGQVRRFLAELAGENRDS